MVNFEFMMTLKG